MAIVVSVIVTSLVMVVAWNSTVMVQSTSNYMKEARAYYVAEGGLQRAYWLYKKDNTYRADPSGSPPNSALTGTDTIEGQTYSYTVIVHGNPNSPVLVTSTATNGSVRGQVHATLAPVVPTPVLSTAGTIRIVSASTNITGNVNSIGSISFTGNGTITGDLLGKNTVNQGSFTVTGTVQAQDNVVATPPDPTTIYNNLQPTGYYYTGSKSNPTLDFSTHPVIYIHGNVSFSNGCPIPTGSGTLVVNGTVTFGGTFPSDGSSAHMNIVANSNISTGGTTRITGGIYTPGTFTETGTHYMTGVIDANVIALNGQTNYTAGPPPSFDPRYSGGGGASSVISSNYGGPNP